MMNFSFFRSWLHFCTRPLSLAWIGLIGVLLAGSISLHYLSLSHPDLEPPHYSITLHTEAAETPSHEAPSPQNSSSASLPPAQSPTAEEATQPPEPEASAEPQPSESSTQQPPLPSDAPSSEPSPSLSPETPSPDASSPPSSFEEHSSWQDLNRLKTPIDKDLLEKTSWGFLPMIGPAQRMSWQAYSRPLSDQNQPKISLVIQVLGADPHEILTHLSELVPEITVSFLPYTTQLNQVIDQVRHHGHEVLLSVPMEPMNLDNQDPGPYTLLTGVSTAKNRDNLYWCLGRSVGYVGVTPYLGHRFVSSRSDLKPVLQELKARGLLFFDPKSVVTSVSDEIAAELHLPYAMGHLILDSDLAPEKIDEAFRTLETIAQKKGYAVGTLFSYPLSLEKVVSWTRTLMNRGYQIVPISYAATLHSRAQEPQGH